MTRAKSGLLNGVAFLLLAYSLSSCALPEKSSPLNIIPSSEAHNAMLPSIRAIIYFQRPTAASKKLSAAISEACRCQPTFVRQYGDDALIYEVALPQAQSFAAFEKILMQYADQLGIKTVEQDRVMRHQ